MVPDYIALGILVFVVLVMFYGVIVIHDIPYEIAKASSALLARDAIPRGRLGQPVHPACALAFLWIWATIYRP